MAKLKRYSVPYLMNYDNDVRQWEVKAFSKQDAREIAKKELSTDADLKHVGSVAHIIDMGEVKQGGF